MSQDGRERDGRCGALSAATVTLLDQCFRVLDCCTDDAFSTDATTIRGGTLGKHLRHTLDHIAAAAEGVSGCVIEYDRRARNVPMESDRAIARTEIALVRDRVERLAEVDAQTPVRVRVMVAADGTEVELASTIGRELAFATHHGVHHLAMMRAIAREFGIEIDDVTGTAPSTLNYARQAR
ncbi:MAG: hypothetical protein SFY69_03910 [Planctomycetota bacterium]|nr:hypothetical protein [Planctomycetota bacterium]